MPRVLRSWLPNGAFHVTARGNRHVAIFRTSADALKLLRLIDEVDDLWERKAYCLMPNHFHFVVEATVDALGRAMKRINGPYTQWFNRKYELSGHLFQGRYAAKPIADEQHLYEAIRYVLLNPVRAGLCAHPAEWPWCNWNEVASNAYIAELVDAALAAAQRGQTPNGV